MKGGGLERLDFGGKGVCLGIDSFVVGGGWASW